MLTFARIVDGQLKFCAYETVEALREVVQDAVDEWDVDDYTPSAKTFAKQVHNHLVLCGHRDQNDAVFHDFDGHHRLKFSIDGVEYYFEAARKSDTLTWAIKEIA